MNPLIVFPGFLLALIPYVLPYVGPALAAVVVATFTWGARLFLAHVKAGKVRHYTLALLDAAKVGVLHVEQDVAPQLRGPDGKLSPDAAAAVKAAAVRSALSWLELSGLAQVRQALALTDEQLAAQLGVAIEAQVAQLPPSVAPVAARQIETLPSGTRVVKPAGA